MSGLGQQHSSNNQFTQQQFNYNSGGPNIPSSRTEYMHSPNRSNQFFSANQPPVAQSQLGGVRASFQQLNLQQPPLLSANMHNANTGNSAQSTQFQFNKTLHQSHVSVRMRANNRDDFTQQLGIKISLHAQTSSSA